MHTLVVIGLTEIIFGICLWFLAPALIEAQARFYDKFPGMWEIQSQLTGQASPRSPFFVAWARGIGIGCSILGAGVVIVAFVVF